MTNAELIKALRNCSSPTVGSCMDCPYYKGVSCKWQMMEDSADALEADDERIAELSLDCEMYQQKCMEMEAQMPKDGEWIEDEYGYIHCSKCKMEWDEPEHPQTKYCPNCGCAMGGEKK